MSLDDLAQLGDGWFDGKGKAPTDKALAVARSFQRCFKARFMYPMPNGGIQIEDDASGYSWTIVIGPQGAVNIMHLEDG